MQTELTERLDLEVPIVQAPIGPAASPGLAAAVAEAGGLGMLAVTWQDAARTHATLEEIQSRTDRPVGVNLVLDETTRLLDADEQLDVCLEAGARIVSFSFGHDQRLIERTHEAGGTVLQTIGSAEDARRAQDEGADVVVAQGREAGGHVQGSVATLPLVPRVVDAVDVPVVAAGGIADGRGAAGALALGAHGVWMGTRFLATQEANVHARYRQRVLEAAETDTVYTTLFDKGWPGQPHRVLHNRTVDDWERAGQPASGSRPGEDDIIAHLTEDLPVERYSAFLPLEDTEGNVEAMALYAGQSVGLTNEVQPAATVVNEVMDELHGTIDRLSELT